MSEYLFGTEEDKNLSTENMSASWNCSNVDILLTQHGLINLRDETNGGKKRLTKIAKKRDAGSTPNLTQYLSALGGGDFCWVALLNSEKNSGFTMGRQHSRALMV